MKIDWKRKGKTTNKKGGNKGKRIKIKEKKRENDREKGDGE